jgi:hypothetical protein
MDSMAAAWGWILVVEQERADGDAQDVGGAVRCRGRVKSGDLVELAGIVGILPESDWNLAVADWIGGVANRFAAIADWI